MLPRRPASTILLRTSLSPRRYVPPTGRCKRRERRKRLRIDGAVLWRRCCKLGTQELAGFRVGPFLTVTPGPQSCPPGQSSPFPHSRHRRHPPRWSLPRQARRSPEAPRAGCPPRHRSVQNQRCSPAKGQRPICHRDLDQGGSGWCGRQRCDEGQRVRLLHQGQGFQEVRRGCFLQAGREA